MKFINLTPHEINVLEGNEAGIYTNIEPSGSIARIATKQRVARLINNHPIYITEYGDIENLPDPLIGVMYITSGLVASRAKRSDVVSPGKLVRNEKGIPIGCIGFIAHEYLPISLLDMELRLLNILDHAGIYCIEQLEKITEKELLAIPMLGKKGVRRILEELKEWEAEES